MPSPGYTSIQDDENGDCHETWVTLSSRFVENCRPLSSGLFFFSWDVSLWWLSMPSQKKTCWLIYSSFVFQGCKLNIWIVWCWIVHCRCPVALRGFGCCWYCHGGQSDESPWVCNGSNISNTIPSGLNNGSWKNGFVIWIRVTYVIFRRFRCKSLRFLIDRLLEWFCFCLDLQSFLYS